MSKKMKMGKKRKGVAVLSAAAFLMLGTTGCAENQIPNLTEEQTEIIKDYVTATVMKYEAGHKSRLLDIPEQELFPPVVSTPQPVPSGDPGQQTPPDGTQGSGSAEEIVTYSMEEVLGLPDGVTVTFLGQNFCSQYPDEEEGAGFTLPASEGKKLLVLSFSLNNANGEECMVDLLSSKAIYGVTINGEYVRRALKTMLLDDLSTFKETLPAGESAEAVLIIEVDTAKAETISSIDLNVKNESKAYTIQLL